MDWQPIETAPRDGTSILAVLAGKHPETGRTFLPAVVEWSDEVGWREVDDAPEDYPPHDWKLTHWMPLPPPPENPNG